jgi:cytoskeleton protein RodZ
MTDIGATLREARLRSRIDITEVEQATKIRTKYLRAMEDEEWGLLPGPTFVKSFLRTYADYLGLDSRMLVEEWKRRYEGVVTDGEAPPPRSRPGRSGGRGGRSSRPPSRPSPPRLPEPPPRWRAYALVGAVIVALFVGLYLLGQHGSDNGTNAASPSGPQTKTAKKKHKKKAAPKPATPQQVKLELTPTGTVYVCLIDETGKVLIPGETLTTASGAQTFTAKRFELNLGNNAVSLKANGKDIPVAASASAIGLTVTPTQNKPLPEGQRPTCT